MPDAISAESLFFAALDLPPADRAAFLDTACGGDTGLRARIEKMLAAQPDLGEFLDQPASPVGLDHVRAVRTPRELSGAVVAGKYELSRPIGEGGMGEVWLAEQRHPVRRTVAVKLVRTEFDGSRGIVARFAAERQAIALMDHPHIAKLLDAGTTGEAEATSVGAGRSYFVMELVDGVPLNEYCDAYKLTVHDRLRLFVQICQAVQHAHQKGVIHRDLKPSNILIEHHAGRPVPRVIDFGLAKATGGARLTDDTQLTRLGDVAGTPLYMAPEQADTDAEDIDTRADVYALGVNLYELLTGTTPIEREQLKQVPLFKILHVIRDSDPPTPSRRLSATASDVAANRRTEPQKLGRFVRGDLDWVVMKALAKERERRYESAAAFAADVERFLNHEPVLAGPPSTAYRLRKFARRHRIPVVAAALLLLVLVAGITGTTAGFFWAEHRRGEAEHARTQEAERRTEAEHARQLAERARDRTWKALDSMTSWVTGEVLAAQPTLTDDQKKFLDEVLANYKEFAAEQADDEQSRFRSAAAAYRVAAIEFRLGRLPEAVAAFRATRDAYAKLVADFPAVPGYRYELAGAMNDLGLRLRDAGNLKEAEEQIRASLVICGELVAEFPEVPVHRHRLAAGRTNLGVMLASQGKASAVAAADEFRKAIDAQEKLVADHPTKPRYRQDLARSYNNLGGQMRILGNRPEAVKYIRQSLAILEKLTEENPTVPANRSELAAFYGNLGVLLTEMGRPTDAAAEHRKAVSQFEKLSADYPSVPDHRHQQAARRIFLGVLLVGLKKGPDAEEQFRKAMALEERLAADYPGMPAYRQILGAAHTHLGDLLRAQGKGADAEEQYRKSIAVWQKLVPELPASPDIRDQLVKDYTALEQLLAGRGKSEDAENQHRLALAVREQQAAAFPAVFRYQTEFGGSACNFGGLLSDRGRLRDGLVWLDKAVVTLTAARDRDPKSVQAREFLCNSHTCRAITHHRLKKYGDAVNDWDRAIELDTANRKPWARANRALSRVNSGQAAEAVAEADVLAGATNRTADEWCTLAGVYSQASGKIGGKEEEYAARAVELLHKAVKAGFRDTAWLTQDADLASLRGRDDFKKLLAELPKK